MKQIQMLDLKLEYKYMQQDIDAAIKQCLEHQRWILGPEVKELEEKIAQYLGVKHCIGACSGTESLVLSLRALAIKTKGQEFFDKSDEILTTSFTFTATGDAILRSGATPVFIDIDPKTYNIDTDKLEQYLASNSNVVGIMPVHLYGQACDMDKVMALAEKHNLFIVEDVAQAFGGGWKDRKLGAIGDAGAFSFFPSKNLGGFGDGGIVATNDDKVAELLRMLIKHGGRDKYNVDHVGYNARLDTLQAAIVLAKFKYIDEFNGKRKQLAELYNDGLKDVKGIVLTEKLADADHVFHQYTIRVLDGKRDELQAALKEKGVSTMIYYPYPLHKMKVFGEGRSKSDSSLAQAETAADSVLSLPMEPLQSAEDASYVIDCIKDFFK
jgi:dTDP-4-amino-4,6-dideoxygalactose transaminase